MVKSVLYSLSFGNSARGTAVPASSSRIDGKPGSTNKDLTLLIALEFSCVMASAMFSESPSISVTRAISRARLYPNRRRVAHEEIQNGPTSGSGSSYGLNRRYYEFGTFHPFQASGFPGHSGPMMDWLIFLALNVSMTVAAASIWRRYLGRSTQRPPTRKPRAADDEFRIEPSTVPEFKSTWRNAR